MSPDSEIIRLQGISKSFGPIHANRHIDLRIHAGRIKAILGENGAGKSTLMAILSGLLQPDRGRIYVAGRPVRFSSTRQALNMGVGMVYQHFKLVDTMSVAENLFLSARQGVWLSPGKMVAATHRLAARYKLEVDPTARVADLSMGERQRIEILKLLKLQSRVLIFDEPTAVLTPLESQQLFKALKEMRRQGKAIVFISHKLDEVMEIADEIAILRRGRIVGRLDAGAVASKAELARLMVGREILLNVEKTPCESKQIVLKVEHLSGGGLGDVSLQIRQGEILALVGVAGNGQKVLAETLCGLRPPAAGHVRILGASWKRFYANPASSDTLSYIPEDRQRLATCLGLNMVDNFLLTTRLRFCRGIWLKREQAQTSTRHLVKTFGIQPDNIALPVVQLSGGNLQKLVLAREFYRRPRLIIAEQPTQGLDISATEEIWNLLLKARERAGILLITSDLGEALSLADHLAVMFSGRIVGAFAADDAQNIASIGALMAGIQPATGENLVRREP